MAISEEMVDYIIDHLDEILSNKKIKQAIDNKKNNKITKIDDASLNSITEELEEKTDKMYFFGLEDLVGNLFYIFKKNKLNIKEVPYKLIEEYADMLKDKFLENKTAAVFTLSRSDTIDFLNYNKDLYEEIQINDSKGISMIKDLSEKEFIEKYHTNLIIDALMVFLDEEIAAKIIDKYNESKEKIKVKNIIIEK